MMARGIVEGLYTGCLKNTPKSDGLHQVGMAVTKIELGDSDIHVLHLVLLNFAHHEDLGNVRRYKVGQVRQKLCNRCWLVNFYIVL